VAAARVSERVAGCAVTPHYARIEAGGYEHRNAQHILCSRAVISRHRFFLFCRGGRQPRREYVKTLAKVLQERENYKCI
jgi:hypothetical protein